MKCSELSKLSGIMLEHSKISGTFSPDKLFHYVMKECGKVDYLAVFILSDIIYWHRLDKDGNKRFRGEALQKSYDDYASKYCAPKRTIKASFDLLVELGFITREFKTVKLKNGQKISNVMYLELNIEKLLQILKVEENVGESFEGDFSPSDENRINDTSLIQKPQNGDNNDEIRYSYYKDDNKVSQKKEKPITENCNTYTNTTLKDYSDNIISFISPDGSCKEEIFNERLNEAQIRGILSDNVEIEALVREQPSSAGAYREYFEVMVDLCCHNKRPVKILGNIYSAETVKNRMFQLRREHLEYVCEKYENYVGKITDFHAHITATLYRSYFEVNSYISNLRNNIEYDAVVGAI